MKVKGHLILCSWADEPIVSPLPASKAEGNCIDIGEFEVTLKSHQAALIEQGTRRDRAFRDKKLAALEHKLNAAKGEVKNLEEKIQEFLALPYEKQCDDGVSF